MLWERDRTVGRSRVSLKKAIGWEALGPIPRRTGAGVMPGKGSRAGERWNRGDTNNVMVRNVRRR